MNQWRRATGGVVPGLTLAAIGVLALPLAARQPPRLAAAPNPAVTDSASATDGSCGSAGSATESSEQLLRSAQPDGQGAGDSATSATGSEEKRLAVNPVTGLVTASALDYVPLTPKERWKVYWKQTYFSFGAYFKPVFFALVLDQTQNSPPAWGGGLQGYGLRVASRTGNSFVQGTIRAPLAAALHEDVRYVYSGRHNGWRRLLYSVEYSFLTYNSEGRTTLNVSKLVGYYSSSAISTVWHPPGHSVALYTLSNGSEQLGLSVPINILQEFWPNVTRTVKHLH